jgi:outer membrane protein
VKIPTLILLCLSTCTFAADPIQEPVPEKLDLSAAETMALRYAPQISQAYFNAQASQEVIRETRSGLFPQITGIVSAVGTGPGIVNAFGGHDSTTAVTRVAANGGLNNPSVYNRESNGLLITQLITDFGRTSNLISAARYQALSQEQKTRLARAQVLLLVDEAYFKALGAQALLRVANQTVAARQLTVDQVTQLTKGQLKSDLDLSFAKVDLENAKLLVLQSQNAVDEGFADLSAALGYRDEHHFTLSEEAKPDFPPENIETLIGQALEYRPEIVALRAELEGDKKFTAAERAARYPTVTLQGAIGRTPTGDAAVEGNYEAAGINVEVPIFTGGLLTARYEEAADRARAAAKAVQDAEDGVVRDVRNSWLDALTVAKKIQATKELLASANEEMDLASSRYKLGVTSIIELSQAQLAQTQAEIGYESAKYEYQIDCARLEFQIGALKFRTPGTLFH